ncbi:SPOR domain-containing protein [Gluconacetobacter sp. 1c LMG 22058]|uniref:SPOR domain-containing protein n=1 Tax=Gluconacetobacter dulcium TaxID=2729096 RepID=A0A7W4PI27_9PROT|nr:SPOR domain-containing protein [Gluconacetobacter dulcium]MBB2198340.1 SPOR domain-containing protein [Gluconacetobacter dulcium]
MSDTDPSGRDPYEDRLNRVRERMSADYGDEEAPPPQRKRPARRAGGLLGADPTTRRLAYGAAGLGGLLVLGIGGWALLGHQQTGIPVLGPPPGPVRVRPVDPGGMQVLGAEAPSGDDGAVARLAPGPEQPRPDRLAQQYGQPPATDAAPATATASTPVATPPAAASVPAPASAPVSEAPLASPAASPAPAAAVPGSGAALPPPSASLPAKPAASAPVATSAAPAVAPAAPAPVAGGRYGVQLAALDSQQAAEKEWARLTQHYPELFGSHTPVIERTERNGAVFFRLRTRGFASIAQATSFCEHVRLNGLACTLAGF